MNLAKTTGDDNSCCGKQIPPISHCHFCSSGSPENTHQVKAYYVDATRKFSEWISWILMKALYCNNTCCWSSGQGQKKRTCLNCASFFVSFCFYLNNIFFIYFTYQPALSPSSPPIPFLFPNHLLSPSTAPPSPSEMGRLAHGPAQNIADQVEAGPSSSLYVEAGPSNPAFGTDY